MASTRPRGSSLWVGLDPFGSEVVGRLQRWLTEDPTGRELAEANRLLPFVPLPEPDEAAPGEVPYDPAADLIQTSIAELLAAGQSREALRFADREVLVPHVWLVADLESAETEHLAPWLARLVRRLHGLHVEARVYLLLRNLSWGRSGEGHAEVVGRLRRLTEEVLAADRKASVSSVAFVVADRDGVLGVYSRDETTAVAHRFADLLLLGDLAHGTADGVSRVFVPPLGGGPGGWETLPIFGSCAGAVQHWDAWSLFRENAEQRRATLFAALERPAPSAFEPNVPTLVPVSSEIAGGWPVLDLPRWSPRFWNGPREEHDRAVATIDAWKEEAARWRHQMLVAYEDRRTSLDAQSEQARLNYLESLDNLARQILDDESLPGFFSPLRRLYDRAKADLRVRRSDLGRRPVPVGGEPADAAGTIPEPAVRFSGADDALVAALERKINPRLMGQVAVMTFLMGVWWIAALLGIVNSWNPPFAEWLRGQIAPLEEWLAANPAQGLPWLDAVRLAVLTRLLDFSGWLAALGIPGLLRFGVALATVLAAVIAATAGFTALRQRVVLERAYKRFYDQARQWRDRAANDLPARLKARELALSRTNITTSELVIDERRRRLEEVRALCEVPLAAADEADLAVSGHIQPYGPPPRPLTDLQTSQIVAAFRRSRLEDPALRAEPPQIVEGLFREASRVVGDPDPDLLLEIARVRQVLLTTFPPDGAVRCPPLAATMPAEFAPPAVARFVGAPMRVAEALRLPTGSPPVVPLPIDDRFYGVVVRSGMSARRVLGMEWEDGARDDTHESGEPTEAAAG